VTLFADFAEVNI